MRAFIEEYRLPFEQDKITLGEDPEVSIASMPLTTLHFETLERLAEVNSYRMTEDMWILLWES